MVRSYLTNLRDDPEDRKGRTLQRVARENEIPIAALREFRDGKNEALAPMVVNTWAKILGTDGDLAGMFSDISPISRDWYQQTLLAADGSRLDRYEHYEIIDRTRPEAASALDAWADIVCTGSVGETGHRAGDFEPEVKGGTRAQTMMREIADHINGNILPDDQRLMLIRDMAKHGDDFDQIGLGKIGGRTTIVNLRSMPVKTMWVKPQPDGSVDPRDAYVQLLPGQREPVATWPAWKIVQFSNRKSRSSHYGTSIFESCMRSYIQLEAMEAAMIIRRLERAPLRMKHVLDVGHLASEQETKAAKEDYRRANRKVKTVDSNRNLSLQRISMPADEDYLVAKRSKDSPADISPLEGDAHIDKIDDFSHFFNKWLSGLGPPKAHLGYESDTMRSVVTDLHIVFARKGRRMQMHFIKGLNHLYWVELILRGIDPRSLKYSILPPALGTRDELVRAQIQLAHSTTVRNLSSSFAQSGKMPSIPWFLRYVMGLDQDTIEGLDLVDVMQVGQASLGSGEPSRKESLEMASAALANPETFDQATRMRFVLEERAIAKRKPELMGLDWPRLEQPFGHRFDDVVRSLGVKELHVVE